MLTKWPQLKNLHTVSAHSSIQMCIWFIPPGVPDCQGLVVSGEMRFFCCVNWPVKYRGANQSHFELLSPGYIYCHVFIYFYRWHREAEADCKRCSCYAILVRLDTQGLNGSLTRLIHYSLPSEAFTTLAANAHTARGNNYNRTRNLSPALYSVKASVIYLVKKKKIEWVKLAFTPWAIHS